MRVNVKTLWSPLSLFQAPFPPAQPPTSEQSWDASRAPGIGRRRGVFCRSVRPSVSLCHSGILGLPFPFAPGGRQPLAGSQLWGVSSCRFGGGSSNPGRRKRLDRLRLVLPGSLHCSAEGTAWAIWSSRTHAQGARLLEPGPRGGGAGSGSDPAPPLRSREAAGPRLPGATGRVLSPRARGRVRGGETSPAPARPPSSVNLLPGYGREPAGRAAGGARRGEGATVQPIRAAAGAPPPRGPAAALFLPLWVRESGYAAELGAHTGGRARAPPG